MNARWAVVATGFFFGLLAYAITSRTPVTGVVGGHSVTSTLDSAIAEEALAALTTFQPQRHPTVAQSSTAEGLPTFDELQALSRETSPDTATLILIDRISRIESHHKIQTLYDSYLQRLRQWGRGGFGVIATCMQGAELPEIHFVPGWLYARNPWTGADFAAQRRLFSGLGLRTTLVEVGENDSVEANAKIVAQHLGALDSSRRASFWFLPARAVRKRLRPSVRF